MQKLTKLSSKRTSCVTKEGGGSEKEKKWPLLFFRLYVRLFALRPPPSHGCRSPISSPWPRRWQRKTRPTGIALRRRLTRRRGSAIHADMWENGSRSRVWELQIQNHFIVILCQYSFSVTRFAESRGSPLNNVLVNVSEIHDTAHGNKVF